MRVLRELAFGVLEHDLLIFGDDFLQRLGVEFGVELGFLLLLLAVEDLFKRVLGNVEHHAAEHLDEAAVGVVGEAGIVAALGQTFDRLVVEAEVEDGVHHAGHGELRAGADADQQRIVGAAELLALQFLEAGEGFVHLLVNFGRDVLPVRMYSRQASVWMVKPGGTGKPALVISASPAPLPPSSSFIFPWPSAWLSPKK